MNTDEWMDRVVVAAIRWHEARERALELRETVRGRQVTVDEEHRIEQRELEAVQATMALSKLIRQKP